MGRAAESLRLTRLLSEYLNAIHETLQMLDERADSSLEKMSWNDVVMMGEQVSKQATMVGMLWAEETPEVKTLEESMAAYFNMLQGFLLLSIGSTVGAGPTLTSCIHASVKQVVDASFMLMKKSVSSFGNLYPSSILSENSLPPSMLTIVTCGNRFHDKINSQKS